MTAKERERWKEASPGNPCPVCGANKWCRVSPDGRVCNCRHEARGAAKTGTYGDGGEYYVHKLIDDGPKPNGKPRRKANRSAANAKLAAGDDPAGGLSETEASARDNAYRMLLNALTLSAEHRQALKGRGLTDEQIDASGYRTLPHDSRQLAGRLFTTLGKVYKTIPGFIVRPKRIAAPAGLLVPVRDVAGRILALKLRADNPMPDAGKYLYVSSAKYGGPSPGSPAHVPAGVCGPVEMARITEGELKADVATRLSHVPTVSFPGVASWRAVLPVLQALRVKTVRIAFDADAIENPHVAQPMRDCVKELQAHGYGVELERWPAGAGKGVDDVLQAGRVADIETFAGPAALAAAEQIAAAAGVDEHEVDLPIPSKEPNEAVDDPHRLARLYITRHATDAYVRKLWFWRDNWHRWDGTAYRVLAIPEIRAALTRLAKIEFDAENVTALQSGEDEPPTCRKVTAGIVANVAHALASECLLPGTIEQPTWLDHDSPFPAAEVLATASGLLHLPSLTTGEPCLLPPTPTFFSSNALPYGFNAAAGCPEWLRFLGTLWSDDAQSIDTLSEWFGYNLLPDTRHHKLLMLIGPPRSGKGTIARVLRGLIGEQNLASPTLASLAGPFGLWPLLGKMVALVADARLSGRADAIAIVERLLSISGEDPQDVARKNMPTLAGIRLPVRFVVMTNELPNMRDASGALTTRVILLRLTRDFRGREDKTLIERLLRELPGILNWSIRGWQRLQERGAFVQPESGQELLDDLQDLASPIGAFVRDCCIIGPEFLARIDDLFTKWREWCEIHGRDHFGTREAFGKNLRAAFQQIRRRRPRRDDASTDRRETIYEGIGLR